MYGNLEILIFSNKIPKVEIAKKLDISYNTLLAKLKGLQPLKLDEAMVALLRSEIITLYNRYEGKGYMPIYARETLHKLHKPYKVLGGNGTIDNIMELVDAMPTRPPNDKEES